MWGEGRLPKERDQNVSRSLIQKAATASASSANITGSSGATGIGSHGGGRRWKCTWIRRRPPWRTRPQGKRPAGPHRDAASGSRRSDRPNPDRAGGRMARPLGPRSGQLRRRGAEVHDQVRHQADLYVAGLLAKASERRDGRAHRRGDRRGRGPAPPVEKKNARWWFASGGLAITVMTLYAPPHAPARDEAARGAGCTPSWPPIGSARGAAPTCRRQWAGKSPSCRSSRPAASWPARAGVDEKAVRRIATNWGPRCWPVGPAICPLRRGECPAGEEFKGKRVVVAIDGGRVRVRTVIKKVRIAGKIKRQRSRWSGASPSW